MARQEREGVEQEESRSRAGITPASGGFSQPYIASLLNAAQRVIEESGIDDSDTWGTRLNVIGGDMRVRERDG